MIQQKNINTGSVNTNGGDFRIGDNFYKSAEYQDFQKQISRLQRLIELTDDMSEKLEFSKELNEIQNQLEAFKRDIIQLAETFQNVNPDNKVINLAKQKYHEGKIKEAYSLLKDEQTTNGLDVLLERHQKDLKNKAEELLLLAQLTAVNYDLGEKRYEAAKRHFEQSLKADRNIENIFAFAHFLDKNKQILEAIPLYEEIIVIYSEVIERDEYQLSILASTLNNLGVLYHDKNDYDKAEQTHKKVLTIYQQLARINRQIHLPHVAATLNNLGVLHHDNNDHKKAEQAYKEVLAVYRSLSQVNPQTFLPYVAGVLNNLANLNEAKAEYDTAEQFCEKALTIYQQSAQINPETYRADVATTLNNWGGIQLEKNELDKAEKAYKEALKINQELAQINPQIFLPSVAGILNNLGLLQKTKEQYDNAEKTYEKGLAIYQQLVELNPQTFLPYVARNLNNLGNLQKAKKQYVKAEQSYSKALEIWRKFSELLPKVYLPDLARTIANMSRFYCYSYPQKEKSVELAIEVIKIAMQFQHIPNVMKYAGSAGRVLKEWDIDWESLFDEDDESPE